MKKKVIVAGHICLDITPDIPAKDVRQIGEILQPGKLIHLEGAAVSLGGAVANTGLAMQLFGCDVSLMAKTGNDAFGTMIREALAEHGADDDLIISEKSSTSFTIALAVPGIDRIFLHCPGANDDFSAGDIPYEKAEKADLFHFGYPPLMRKMYENDGAELAGMFERLHRSGVVTSLDLAGVDADAPAGRADWKKILSRTLCFTDIFVPSVEELLFMLDRDRYSTLLDKARGRDLTELVTMEDLHALGDFAIKAGAGIVMIKCGARGIYCCTAPEERMSKLCSALELDEAFWCGYEGFEASYKQDSILSGTGAGDTCIAAFLTAVLNREPLETALHLAAAAGALCISAYDSLSGLKPMNEMKEMIRAGWEKNPVS